MDVDHLGGCESADPTPSRACPSCAALDAIVIQRDKGGRVIWTPEIIAAIESQHVKEGRSYKWLAQRLDFKPDSLKVVLHHWRRV